MSVHSEATGHRAASQELVPCSCTEVMSPRIFTAVLLINLSTCGLPSFAVDHITLLGASALNMSFLN